MAEKYSLKDELFNAQKVAKIASEIKAVYGDFEQERFEKEVVDKFPELELKERIFHIREMLATFLPDDFTTATNILLSALPEALDSQKKDDDFGDFIYSPYSEFVTEYGCRKEYLDFSLQALREITKRFSVEFAIRDFINQFPKETYAMFYECSLSDNYHERRLASEGRRIKLPWAKKVEVDFQESIKILDNLYSDDARFVTRSVANHLNDLSKVDAHLVLDTLKRWKKSQKQDVKEMAFIINHALRTLIKEGHKETLEFLGFSSNPQVRMVDFRLQSSSIMIGEALEISFALESVKAEGLIVDYVIYFRTKNGSLNPKVHKLKKFEIEKDKSLKLSKKHLFKAGMTTRKLYAGEHKVQVQINGKVYAEEKFELQA